MPSAVRSAPLPSPRTQSPIKPVSPSVAIEGDIARLCALSVEQVSKVEKAPKFDFDKSDLTRSDHDVLEAIARCLTSGPLRGRRLTLVGRADPRGETEYNMGLGSHRADSVKAYLTRLGVEGGRIAATSRGELDASGRDEDGWSRDRRVDVLLR